MPTPSSVGPDAMPSELEPIEAPFDMPRPQRPVFPDRTVTITDLGAKPGGDALVTGVIQQAIDDTSSAGGGTVVIPAGEWRTGRIVLKSGVNLRVEEGARLRFSGRIEDYLPVVFSRYEGIEVMSLGGLVYAHGQSNVALTGRGTLIGPDEGPVREARKGLSDEMVDADAPIDERVFDGREGRHYFRPYFVATVDCENVFVEGVSLRNGPMWNVVATYCDGVVVRGVRIDSRGVVNGDGVNVDSSRNVVIEYCDVNTGDDCYAMKAGRDEFGLRVGKPAERVVIRHCRGASGYGGVTVGSETAGVVRDVHVHDCLFDGVSYALYFKTRRPRGGGGERFLAERIAFTSNSHAVFFDMIGSPLYVGELGERLPRRELTPLTPFYRDITVRRIQGRSVEGEALKIKGIPESPATRVRLENVDIQSRGLVNLADAEDVTIADSRLASETGEIQILDSRRVRFVDTEFVTDAAPLTVAVRGEHSAGVLFEDCAPVIDADRITTADGAAAGVVEQQ